MYLASLREERRGADSVRGRREESDSASKRRGVEIAERDEEAAEWCWCVVSAHQSVRVVV